MTALRDARDHVTTLETYSGRFLDYSDPQPEQIELADIARGLSQTCRFAGQTTQFYSVAEHAVYVSHLTPRWLALSGLHHDSHEAYVGDWPSPLKHMLGGGEYEQIVYDIDRAIAVKFAVLHMHHPLVREADITALRAEAATLKWSHGTGPHWGWSEPLTPLAGAGWSPSKAEREFIKRHHDLCAQ